MVIMMNAHTVIPGYGTEPLARERLADGLE